MIKPKQIQRPQLVMIVDDHEINRDAIGAILEDDYELIFAENGREAIDLMQKHATELSIVLLDLIMPVMSGFEVLAFIQKDELLRTIPVIVLTAEKQAELKRFSFLTMLAYDLFVRQTLFEKLLDGIREAKKAAGVDEKDRRKAKAKDKKREDA